MMENLVELGLAGKTEELGEILHQRHLVQNKFQLTRLGNEPGPARWDASD
jgi:hypothetical protein